MAGKCNCSLWSDQLEPGPRDEQQAGAKQAFCPVMPGSQRAAKTSQSPQARRGCRPKTLPESSHDCEAAPGDAPSRPITIPSCPVTAPAPHLRADRELSQKPKNAPQHQTRSGQATTRRAGPCHATTTWEYLGGFCARWQFSLSWSKLARDGRIGREGRMERSKASIQ